MELDSTFKNDVYSWVSKFNQNGNRQHPPYHNTNHCLQVAETALMLYTSDLTDQSRNNSAELYVAAAFHDFNHSGGAEVDSVNIKRAIREVANYISIVSTPVDLKMVADIIRCTEFPFVYEPVTLEQKCIRDADLIYVMSTDYISEAVRLHAELSIAGKTEMSLKQFLQRNADFYKSVVMFTETGKRIWDNSLDDLISTQLKYADTLQ